MGQYDGTDAAYQDSDGTSGSSSDSSSSSSSKSGLRKGIEAAGKSLSQRGTAMVDAVRDEAAAGADRQAPINLPSYRKGGKVRKTGMARLHKGEKVIPRNKVKKVEKAVRKAKKKSGREM